MPLYTHTPEQHSAILTARKQLIDHGDEKTAATLAWALTSEPATFEEATQALEALKAKVKDAIRLSDTVGRSRGSGAFACNKAAVNKLVDIEFEIEAMFKDLESAAPSAAEPVAVVGTTFQLLWTCSGPLFDHAQKHGIKIGTKLYTRAPAPEEAKDAARYRWLRGDGAMGFGHPRWACWQVQTWGGNPLHWANVAGAALDAAIDAAMAQGER